MAATEKRRRFKGLVVSSFDLLHALKATEPNSAGETPSPLEADERVAWLEDAFDPVVVLDRHRRPAGSNAAARSWLGPTVDLVARLTEESRPIFTEGWQALVAGGRRWRGDVLLHRADGTLGHSELQLLARGPSGGTWDGAVAIVRDTTRRREAWEKVLQTEAQLRESQEIAHLGSWDFDVARSQLRWSDETYRIHGLEVGTPVTVAEAIGFYGSRFRATIEAAVTACLDHGQPFDLELQIRNRGGALIWVRAKGQAQWEAGQVVRLRGIFQDIDDRKRSEVDHERYVDRLRMAAEAAGMGVWEWDAATGDLFWDTVQQDLHGLPGLQTLTLAEWLGLVHAEDREQVQAEFERAAQGDDDLETVFRVERPDGRERHLRVAARRHEDESTGAVRLIGVALDITTSHERQQALEWAREGTERANHELRQAILRAERSAREADAANRAKSEFLAVMSHEIRTPMNGVLGFADILGMMDLSPEQREYVDTIRESGTSLLHLIDDILDYSKIESGRLELETQTFSLGELLEDVIRLNEPQASTNLVLMEMEVESGLPDLWVGDETRLRQVLMNLVGNACKFTRRGRVVLRVREARSFVGGQFEVEDTGIGMDEDAMTRLFLPFSQADSSTTRRFGGTGLGLAICKRLVELMGGRIWAESEPSVGSKFSFSLPLGREEVEPKATEAPVVPAPEPAPASVVSAAEFVGLRGLLVEDNPVNRRLAGLLIRRLGFTLEEAVDGFAGLERLTSHTYDVVFMDIQMPGLDGVEVTRRVRANAQLEQPIIIAVTAFAMDGDRERFLAAGMDGYVSKPVTRQSLADAIREALPKRQA